MSLVPFRVFQLSLLHLFLSFWPQVILLKAADMKLPDYCDHVVIKPRWLCDDVFRSLLSPYKRTIDSPPTGIVSEATLRKSLRFQAVNVDPVVLLQAVELYKLGLRCPHDNSMFIIPGLVQAEEEVAEAKEVLEQFPIRRGARLQPSHHMLVQLSPGFMLRLQLACCTAAQVNLNDADTFIWKGGLIFPGEMRTMVKVGLGLCKCCHGNGGKSSFMAF